MEIIAQMAQAFARLRVRLSRHHRALLVMAAVVVFVTTYALMLPAVTLDEGTADDTPGISVATAELTGDAGLAGTDAEATGAEDAVSPNDVDAIENPAGVDEAPAADPAAGVGEEAPETSAAASPSGSNQALISASTSPSLTPAESGEAPAADVADQRAGGEAAPSQVTAAPAAPAVPTATVDGVTYTLSLDQATGTAAIMDMTDAAAPEATVRVPAAVTYEGVSYAIVSFAWGQASVDEHGNPLGAAGTWAPADQRPNVAEIVLPDTLRDLLDVNFARFPHLRSVTIPSRVTAIPGGTFAGCASLTRILDEGSRDDVAVDAAAFVGTGLLDEAGVVRTALGTTYEDGRVIFATGTPTEAELAADAAASDDGAVGTGDSAAADARVTGQSAAGTLVAENEAYRVTVSFGVDAQVPAGATLSLTNLAEGDDAYASARAAVLAATGASEDELGLAALDVSIVSPDGTEIEPAAPVDVSLEVKSLPEAVEDGTPLDVQHLTGPSAPAGVASAASPGAVPEGAHGDAAGVAAAMNGQTGGVDATPAVQTVASDVTVSNGGAVAAFTVSSFSTFTITWNKGFVTRATLTVHHVDQSGAEIQAPDQQDVTIKDDLTLDLDSYATDAVAGYTYAGAHLDAPDGATVTTVTFAASGVLGFNSAVTFRDGATTVREQSGTVFGDVITADVYLVYARQMTSVSAQTPDGTYTVTVTYGPEAGLPAGTQVSVSTLDEDAAESVRAQIASAQAAHYDGYDQDGLRIVGAPLDICLTADGAEVEPAAGSSVHVSISAQVLPEDADFPTLQSRAEVQHVTDSGDVQTVADAVGSNGGRVAVRTDGVTADFDVSSFSTFTVTYWDWWDWDYTSFSRIYVVDESGASIGSESARTVDARTYISDLANAANPSSEDYTFVQARVGSSFASATTALSSTSGYIAYNHRSSNWVYSPDAQVVYPFGSSQSLYLVYRKAPKRVTITFNANGGSASAPAAQTALVDATITLPDYAGTRAGYVFMGWSTSRNLATSSYADLYPVGSTYTVPDANTTLYAVWSSTAKATATFYVRLDATIPAEPGAYPGSNYSDGIRLNENIDMKRWIVDTDSTKPLTTTGAKNAKGERNYLENDVTANLAAVPTNEQLATVINGRTARTGLAVRATADGELEVTSIKKGSAYDLTSMFSVGDRLYVHWYVQKAQDRDVNWHVDGSLRVKSKIGITYDGNPNSAANNVPISYQETAGTTVTVGASGSRNGTIETPSRPGYVFEGWNTSADGNGTTYQPGDSLTLNENTVLYAMWSKGLNRMTVHKQDESGAILAGAKFTLEERSGGDWLPVTSGTTDGQGVFSFPSVRSQTVYRLTETYAPNGFETRHAVCFEVTTGDDGSTLTAVVVDEDGQRVATPDWLTVTYTPSSMAGGSASLVVTMRDEQIRRKVVFVKTAEDGTTPLAGARFSLTRAAGEAQEPVAGVLADASDDQGRFGADGATLTYGTYTLTETEAPAGYQLAAPITLTLNDYVSPSEPGMTATGAATVRCDVGTSVQDGVVTTTYTYTVTVRDAPLASVTVIKTDEGTPATTLSGATFRLTRSVNGAEQAVVIDGVTDAGGQFTITDPRKDTGVTLAGLVDGTYRLKETKAPPGYVTATSDVVFTVTDGAVGLDATGGSGSNATLAGGGPDATLTVTNAAGHPLPSTGGIGARPFALAGGCLVILALLGLLASRRGAERRDA